MPSPLSIDPPRESPPAIVDYPATQHIASPPQYPIQQQQYHYLAQQHQPQQPQQHSRPAAPPSKDTLRPPSPVSHRSPPPLAPLATLAAAQDSRPASESSTHPRSGSPVAPEYSPITPKVQPALPVGSAFIPPPDNGGAFTFSMADTAKSPPRPQPELPRPAIPSPQQQQQQQQQVTPSEQPKTEPEAELKEQPKVKESAPEAVYIPQPPDHPFSTDDATDAIALRAAISTLQFQKKKAQDDMRTLARIKQMALEDPDHFKTELAAGRLKEQRHTIGGNMQAILADLSDGDDDDDFVFPAAATSPGEGAGTKQTPEAATTSEAVLPSDSLAAKQDANGTKPFPRIPGAQDVVRMPYVNWDKYGIVGAPLESIHAQQKKWPGAAAPGPGQSRGREYAVAAPYSAFHDRVDAAIPQVQHRAEVRKDSAAVSPSS